MKIKKSVATCLLVLLGVQTVYSHHAPALYDSSVSISIQGKVVNLRYQNPHSRLTIMAVNAEGKNEQWIITLPAPRMSKRQKQEKVLTSLKSGDEISVVGWPHKVNHNEIRSETITFPDKVVRRQVIDPNFKHKDNIALEKYLQSPELLAGTDIALNTHISERIREWVKEDNYVLRLAIEVNAGRAAFIGISKNDSTQFVGVEDHLSCLPETKPADILTLADHPWLTGEESTNYIETYNDLLARHLETSLQTCGH